jgi:hypothetical protein
MPGQRIKWKINGLRAFWSLKPSRTEAGMTGARSTPFPHVKQMERSMRKIMMAAAALAAMASPALAQLNTGAGLVNVQIGDVSLLNNFLNNTQLAALNNVSLPITVQVPVGVAANVCGVNANVLAQQKGTGTATCTAKNGSRALAQGVISQVLNQKRGH